VSNRGYLVAGDASETAQALWYVGPGKAEIRAEAVAAPGAGDVRVRALVSALSRGTERLIFSGGVPETEYQRMRAPHMGGSFPFPVKYGYAMVGRVEQGPAALTGRLVFALHPHQTVFNLAADNVVPVPEGVPAERAALAANMETALNATWDGAADRASRIAVVGAGVLGLLVARLCAKVPGVSVTVVDIEPSRAAVAQALGLAFAAPVAAPVDCDLVIHTSASEAGLATALRLAAFEATVLELSWYGSREIKVPLGGAFHSQRLKLVSSQVGHVAPSHRATWTYRRRLEAALKLLDDLALDALLAPPVAFAEVPARLSDILGPASGVLCQLIRYPVV
jgi:NADPH:quinone reductase-like Zn-dependent oxidoreductase